MRLLGILLITLSFFTTSIGLAGTQAFTKAAENDLNKASPNAMQKYQLGSIVTTQKVWILKGIYDFAVIAGVSGGSSGTVSLRDLKNNSLRLPSKAIVTDCLIDVITAPTGNASATLAFSTGQSAGDLKAATVIGGYASGSVACIPVGTAATSIKMTADRTPSINIVKTSGGSGLTAGKINVLIQYILSD